MMNNKLNQYQKNPIRIHRKCQFYHSHHRTTFSLESMIFFLQSRPFITVSLATILLVWSLWLLLLGPNYAISNLREHWAIATTMLFGSMVAGGTSMGGGAVAFPVLTKVLSIPAHDAKVFSLAIQTVGMGAASLTIVAMGIRLQWPFIRFASLGGILGVWLGSAVLAPLLPADAIRFLFTMMISSFASVLLLLNRKQSSRNFTIPMWGTHHKMVAISVGLVGGIVSGLVGTGMDICTFSVMVIMFGLCEKSSTPTSVVLMAINAAAGFFVHQFVINDFNIPIQEYWFAAIPIVVVGAPAGAIICNFLSRQSIVSMLVVLIALELSSSLLLIPLNFSLITLGVFAFSLFSFIYYWMHRVKVS